MKIIISELRIAVVATFSLAIVVRRLPTSGVEGIPSCSLKRPTAR